MTEVLILDALRAAAPLDGLAPTSLDGVGALVRRLVERRGLHGVEELILGRSQRAGPAGLQDPARAVALAAGLPLSVGGFTVDRGGCAGLQALACGTRAIASGDRDVVVVAAASWGAAAPAAPCDAVAWRSSRLVEEEAVSLLRERFGLSPDDELRWAEGSVERASASAHLHARDLLGPSLAVPADGHGMTTAPKAEGAVALVLGTTHAAERLGVEPRARIVTVADAALDPGWRGLAAGQAALRALERASLRAADLDLVELDEGHAAWSLASATHAGLPLRRCQLHGGALALGHLGPAEGLRQALTLLGGLEESEARMGLCARGGADGQALAVVVDRARYA